MAVVHPHSVGGTFAGRTGVPVWWLQLTAFFRQRDLPNQAFPELLTIAGLLLWLQSITALDASAVVERGLLALLPPGFYAGLLLTVTGAVLHAVMGTSSRRTIFSVLAVVIVLHATHPILFASPRYPWTFKHIGVAEQFLSGHGLRTEVDVYQRWPGFFGAAAAFSDASGISDLTRVARWAPLFFQSGFVVAAHALFNAVGGRSRQRALALVLFVLGNWVGQDYFAPQALAYLLLLVLFSILLRLVPRPARHSARTNRFAFGSAAASGPSPGRSLLVGAAVLVGSAITITHQITPVAMLVAATTLVVVYDLVRPRALVAVLGLISVGFVAIQLNWLNTQYGILDFGVLGGKAASKTSGSVTLSAVERFSAFGARLLSALLFLIAMTFVVRRFRRERTVRLVSLLMFGPFCLIAVNSYGGEGLYRAFLFALPWIAWLAAGALADVPRRAAFAAPVGAACAAALLFLPASFGNERFQHVSPATADAAKDLYERAEDDATIVLAAQGSFPVRYSPRYWRMAGGGRGSEGLLSMNSALRGRVLTATDLPEVTATMRALRKGSGPSYLVIARTQKAWAEQTGVWPRGAFDVLDTALTAEPGWSLFSRNADVTVWRFADPVLGESERADAWF